MLVSKNHRTACLFRKHCESERLRSCQEQWTCYLHELLRVLMELLQDGQRLLWKAVLENALDDSAAVRMSGEGKHLQDRPQLELLVTQ